MPPLEVFHQESTKRSLVRAARRIAPGFNFTPKQGLAWDMLSGAATHTLFVGGARSGKTFLFLVKMIERALSAPSSRHLVVRLKYNACLQSIWLDTLPKVMRLCFPKVKYDEHRQDKYFKFENGSEIWMGGLDEKDRVEKILGLEYATIMFNECSQIPYGSVVVALTRLAQKCITYDGHVLSAQAYYDLNPTGTAHWTYKLFFEHKDPEDYQSLPEDRIKDHQTLYMMPGDNADNLPDGYIERLKSLPARQRKRFFEGEYQAEVDGALWTIENLDQTRIEMAEPGTPGARGWRDDPRVPSFKRVVIGVDPSGTSGDENARSNEVGIVVVGLGIDDHAYVVADITGNMAPEQWARRICGAHSTYLADMVVAEVNYGGDMVRATIHAVERAVRVRVVTASRGKHIRAEPVSALYDQGSVHHVGTRQDFLRLEDQMLNFSTAGYMGSKSPDRADALIWALTELLVKKPKTALPPVRRLVLPIYQR